VSPTLAILTHPADDFGRRPHLARLMIPLWEAMGVRVVVVRDPAADAPADVALLHVSLTVVPESQRSLAGRYPRVVNGGALDLRRSRWSRLRVGREGADPGPVIVKTDLNSHGWRELRGAILGSAAGSLIRRLGWDDRATFAAARLAARRSWSKRRHLPGGAYPVYPRREAVPEGVWSNPHLVVERYLPEPSGDGHVCRHWLFLGDREVYRRTYSAGTEVKMASGPIEATDDGVPDELRAERERLGFDYGKFDYGVVDGEVVLYDANRTPGASTDATRHGGTIAELSGGLRAFLP
jgi:hypothetical protein